jgi:tRNA-dihydrouridine synthase
MPVRVWPSPDSHFSWRIPVIARGSLEEAAKCFKVGAYSACAVMCGRALEGICRHYKTRSTNLAGSLKELLDQGIIDGRLFEWSEALKSLRNIGAHATGVAVSEQDARDLLDFANAICEYIFVLAAKFEEFMERRRTNGEKKV